LVPPGFENAPVPDRILTGKLEGVNMTDFPEIVKAKDVAQLLKLSPRTVFNMASAGKFARGVYIGCGRYNLTKLKECIIQDNTWRAPKKSAACVL